MNILPLAHLNAKLVLEGKEYEIEGLKMDFR
jgi:hypothetical protein